MKKGLIYMLTIILLFLSFIFIISGNIKMEKKDSKKVKIVATLFPQYDFAKQIGGDKVEVSLLLTPGTETHTYEPTPQDIINVNNSNLFIYTGKYMEPWSDKIAQGITNNVKILDASNNIKLIKQDHEENEEHNREHEHEGYDPHIWLNPQYAIIMVKNITKELCEIDSENASFYEKNCEEYIKKINKLDSDIEIAIKDQGKNKIAFGGTFAYAYFVERYNLEYISAYESCGEDVEPSVSKVKEVVDYIKANNINAVFYQELSNGKIADTIAKETGTTKLVMHTVHNASSEEIKNGETYISLMYKNLENLKEALK